MLFYESGHVDPVNQEIEERLENERKDCKEYILAVSVASEELIQEPIPILFPFQNARI